MDDSAVGEALAAEDYGVTAREQRAREQLASRLAREVPDVGEAEAGRPATERPEARHPAWNAVVTVRDRRYDEAVRVLQRFGRVAPTSFYNVCTLCVDDPEALADELLAAAEAEPALLDPIGRVMPLHRTFTFDTAADFEREVLSAVLDWCEDLADAAFHVRVRLRGAPEPLAADDAEQLLGDALLGALDAAGTPGRIAFADPDAVVDVEVVGNGAGVSLWTRDDLHAFPFLGVD